MSRRPPTYPRASIDSAPYWEGCGRGELLFQCCEECAEPVFHPRAMCPYCLSDRLKWKRSAGRGRVYSFSIQHIPLHQAANDDVAPRMLGIAELDEGFHMFAEFVADDVDKVTVGAPLEVFFDRIADDLVLPKFRVGS